MAPGNRFFIQRPWREKFAGSLARWISTGGKYSFGFVGLLVIALIAGLPRLEKRADVDDFSVPTHSAYRFGETLRAQFPRNEFFMVVHQSPNLFTAKTLHDLQNITAAFENIPDVEEVVSLANVNDIRGTEGNFSVGAFLETVPEKSAELEALRRRAIRCPLYRDRLISKDGNTTAIAVFLPAKGGGEKRRRVLQEVDRLLEPYRQRGMKFHLSGWPVINLRLIDSMETDVRRFVPFTLLLVLTAIVFVFRNRWLTLLGGVGVLGTVGATLGLAGWLNVPLNNASVAVIPLVMSLALSDLVHLFSHLDQKLLKDSPSRKEALRRVLEPILFPCALTSLNTALGFLSLTLNSIPAIRNFGWLAASGMALEFFLTFGLIAPALLLFRPEWIYRPEEAGARWIPRSVRGVHYFVSRRPAAVVAVCLGLAGLGAWGARRIVVEMNFFHWFHPRAEIRKDMEFVKTNLSGTLPLYVSFKSTEREAFRDPDRLAHLESIQRRLRQVPGVDGVLSVVDYIQEINGAFHDENSSEYKLPLRRQAVDQLLLLYSASDLEEVVTPSFDHARMVLWLHEDSSRESARVIKDIETILREKPLPGLETRLAGDAINIVVTSQVIVRDQMLNIGQAVLSIWVVMVAVLRSVGLAALFLVPNLFPILMNFGLMGFAGIPIDVGTALIAASAFGIIVDDTVHFFTRYVEIRRAGSDFGPALEIVTFEKGEALISSFVILLAGFGVLSLAEFVPVVQFGLLNVFVLIVGVAGDMFLLKGLMVWAGRSPWFSPGDKKNSHSPTRN